MSKRKDDDLIKLLLLIGGIWLLAKAFKTPRSAGIGGLPNAKRKLINYVNPNGVDEITKDLNQYDRNEIGEIIRTFIDARLRDELAMPFWKTLKGTVITGEFRNSHWRVLVYIINKEEYLILNVFKKKTDETPRQEIEKAERRLKDYLSRNNY